MEVDRASDGPGTYVFCESYVALFLALDLADHAVPVTVITNNAKLATACEDLALAHYLLTACPDPSALRKVSPGTLLHLRHLADWVDREIPRGSDLYFTHTQFSLTAFALVRAWGDHGTVRLWDVEQAHPRVKGSLASPGILKARALLALDELLTGVRDLELRTDGRAIFPAIGQAFGPRYGIHNLALDASLDAVRARVATRHTVPAAPVTNLLCTQPVGTGYLRNPDRLTDIYARIARHDSALKIHPRDRIDPAVLVGFAIYPEHIPAELLLGNVSNAVVALNSSVLITAAAMPHLAAVSILDLVDWCDPSLRDRGRAFLQAAAPSIHFPADVDELEALLSGAG